MARPKIPTTPPDNAAEAMAAMMEAVNGLARLGFNHDGCDGLPARPDAMGLANSAEFRAGLDLGGVVAEDVKLDAAGLPWVTLVGLRDGQRIWIKLATGSVLLWTRFVGLGMITGHVRLDVPDGYGRINAVIDRIRADRKSA